MRETQGHPLFFRFPGIGRTLLAVLAAALSLSACSEIRTLREAQESFNEAAARENLLRYGSQNPIIEPRAFSATFDSADLMAVRVGYANTISALTGMGPKEKAVLEEEGLWGNVLTLKAMAYWRLGKYDNALGSVADAARLGDQLGPRDKAMVEALPSLIRSDQAFHKIFVLGGPDEPDNDRTQRLEDAKKLLRTAMDGLGSVRNGTGKDHPVQAYLIQAQLAVYLNMRDACNSLHAGLGSQKACIRETETHACGAWNDANALLKDRPQDKQDFQLFWGAKTGLKHNTDGTCNPPS